MNLKIFFLPLSIMLSIVIIIWMVKPEWDAYQLNKAALAVADEEFKKVDGQVAALEDALQDYKAKESDRSLILNAIPYEVERENILEEIYSKIKESEVLMTTLSFGGGGSANCTAASTSANASAPVISSIVSSVETVDNALNSTTSPISACLKEEGITLDVVGPFPNIKKAIEQVSRMNRYTEIRNLSLSRSTDENSGNINANFTLKLFYKEKNETVQVANVLSTPAGTVLLQGKIESSVIDKFKEAITPKEFNSTTVTTYGKDSLF